MFDNILLPIDLTHPESWEKALPLAAKMCGSGGTLHVLGIVHELGSPLVASYLPRDFEQKMLQDMKAELDAFVAEKVPFLVQPAERGALPQLYAATTVSLPGGSYVGPDGPGELTGYPKVVGSSARSRDREVAAALWDRCVEMTEED